ncbi:MAG: hypothetical protein ACI9R3_002034 [Verrucomicrobiales bacterium]|jgi:hypothetical protein
MKKVAILQSNYIPWKGYFDLINSVDVFVLYDDMQYTRRDWRNRNKVKGPGGLKWLSVPVEVKGKYLQTIKETRVSDAAWATKHWQTLRGFYAKAPHFSDYAEELESLYTRAGDLEHLSEINHLFITAINQWLGITTEIQWSSDYQLVDGKSERLLGICRDAEASHYLSGPAARDYLDAELFATAGITVDWMDYAGYPQYSQLHGNFEHGVTVLDLLFQCGADAPKMMKSFSPET